MPVTGKFVLTKDKRGEYRIALKAGNGEVLAVDAGGYAARASALKAIECIRKYAADALFVDET